MKIKYIKYVLLSTVLTLGSCSKDYLDTFPTNATSPETAFKTTESVTMAVNGLAKLMTAQHTSQGFNGEGTIKLFYGEYSGSNFRRDDNRLMNQVNGLNMSNNDISYNNYPWHYYYMLVTNANAIIANVDAASGPENERKYLKAQALTYRAYAFTMLNQIYGHRWQDAEKGTKKSIILRLHPDDPKAMPLATQNDVYAQIYKDLDDAIRLFDESKYKRSASLNYLVDSNVSHAVYARAALIKQDYAVALREASLARKGYNLMNVNAYNAGFANPTSEWIWSSYGALEETLYFYSYQAYLAYNASTTVVRTMPGRISKEFYETIPATDIRKGLFLDPTGYDPSTYTAVSGIAKAKSPLDQDARTRFPDIKSNASVAAYMQFKVKANEMQGVGHLNHFRSSEMYFIEAEALHFLGRDSEAAKLLEELTKVSGRDASYTCSKSGKPLFDEIVKYRGIELWGEGFDWFDLKRWNLPIVRKEADKGGNYSTALGVTILPTENNNWTYVIPRQESDYNPNI
ncbi:RagB/SusD family nutrient uptake outer membrane protein [Myroides sp. M-43]|uniref:RagB/SusD family nutrient uptake outer membrane protein n=1 Tax=Myroides oncorhynchi TaxID=2893756 RepID=UPI001E4515C6|nr:RagB/SusD family nutrient uptake outer membrane protein [Myroides oncorhynchi]MCC9042259.1 RagB/SusD family nutrient uptake outer membrane protein [Myroides oncorhynchi]